MIRIILTLLFSCFSLISYAQTKPSSQNYSPAVQQVMQQFQHDIAALNLTDPKEIKAASIPEDFKKILLSNNEAKITRYFAGRKKNFVQSLKRLNQAGDPDALTVLVEWSLFSRDPELLKNISIDPLEQRSKQGDAHASYLMALLLEYTDEYLYFLEKAGQQGSAAAQIRLADDYSFRLPEEQQDPAKARYWSEQAKKSMGIEKYNETVCAVSNCEENLEWEYVEIPMPESLKNQ